jgi:aminobenzoyl-glutamate utilization protein B
MDNRSDIWRGIDAIKGRFVDLSDKVWARVAPQFR